MHDLLRARPRRPVLRRSTWSTWSSSSASPQRLVVWPLGLPAAEAPRAHRRVLVPQDRALQLGLARVSAGVRLKVRGQRAPGQLRVRDEPPVAARHPHRHAQMKDPYPVIPTRAALRLGHARHLAPHPPGAAAPGAPDEGEPAPGPAGHRPRRRGGGARASSSLLIYPGGASDARRGDRAVHERGPALDPAARAAAGLPARGGRLLARAHHRRHPLPFRGHPGRRCASWAPSHRPGRTASTPSSTSCASGWCASSTPCADAPAQGRAETAK